MEVVSEKLKEHERLLKMSAALCSINVNFTPSEIIEMAKKFQALADLLMKLARVPETHFKD